MGLASSKFTRVTPASDINRVESDLSADQKRNELIVERAWAKAGDDRHPDRRGLPIRILSLDGGGIRGVVPLRIMQQIEHDTGKTIPQLFDLVVGTSTGGIIALALTEAGKTKGSSSGSEGGSESKSADTGNPTTKRGWTPSQIKQFYYDQRFHIFSHTWKVSKLYSWLTEDGQYSAKAMENLIKAEVTDEDYKCNPFSTGLRSAAISTLVGSRDLQEIVGKKVHKQKPHAFVWRNYQSSSTLKGTNVFTLWHALRATSSAPGYWCPCLDSNGRVHVDGGLGNNNPTLLAYLEAKSLWYTPRTAGIQQAVKNTAAQSTNEITTDSLDEIEGKYNALAHAQAALANPNRIGMVVSLGTGIPTAPDVSGHHISNDVSWVVTSLTTGEMVHDQCSSLFTGLGMPAYFRFQIQTKDAIDLSETDEAKLNNLEILALKTLYNSTSPITSLPSSAVTLNQGDPATASQYRYQTLIQMLKEENPDVIRKQESALALALVDEKCAEQAEKAGNSTVAKALRKQWRD